MAEKLKHVHKLKRKKYKTGNEIYFCTKPECYFKIGVEFSLGKLVECWRCGQPFTMNAYSVRLAKPHCETCHNVKGQYAGQERRTIPTRREFDPTVLSETADSTIDILKAKLSGEKVHSNITYQTIGQDETDDDVL